MDVQHDVGARPAIVPVPAKDLSKPPPDGVSYHGAAHLPGERQPEPGMIMARWMSDEREVARRDPDAARVGFVEIRLPPGSIVRPELPGTALTRQTVSLFLPLARRRLRTRRPLFVFMRDRNPCVFLRRRTFGWNVLFMVCTTPRLSGFGCSEGDYPSGHRSRASSDARVDEKVQSSIDRRDARQLQYGTLAGSVSAR